MFMIFGCQPKRKTHLQHKAPLANFISYDTFIIIMSHKHTTMKEAVQHKVQHMMGAHAHKSEEEKLMDEVNGYVSNTLP